MNQTTYYLLMMVILVAIMYFLVIRPQRKRDKEMSEMRSALKKGDKIVTIGGIVGTVMKVGDETVVIQVGQDRVKLEMLKSSIGSIRETAPASAGKSKSKEEKTDDEIEEVATKVNRDKKITPKKISNQDKSSKSKKTAQKASEEIIDEGSEAEDSNAE